MTATGSAFATSRSFTWPGAITARSTRSWFSARQRRRDVHRVDAGKRSRDCAAGLRRLGLLLERRLVDAGHVTLRLAVDAVVGRQAVDIPDLNLRRGLDRAGRVSVLGELGAQRHREAAGVGRGNQLLWVGPLALLEPGCERVVTAPNSIADRDRPGAVLQVSVPYRAAVASRHLCLLVSVVSLSPNYRGGLVGSRPSTRRAAEASAALQRARR